MALSRGSKAFLGVMVLLGVLVLGGVVAVNAAGGDTGEDGEQVTIEIPEGAGGAEVADILAENDVVRSALAFRLIMRFDERAQRIQPGTYEVETGMGSDAILDVISDRVTAPDSFRVTIPEGRTVEQTLERLAEAEDSPFSVEELRDALPGVALPPWVPDDLPDDAEPFEGVLFPNTYEFTVDADPQEVLARLVEQTEQVLDEVDPPDELDRYELLVMASLVEREARLADERPLIAAVMHNRLDEGMRLQIDATVLYALGEHRDRVLYEDLEVESPWNTYVNEGLPPTPISGAGRAAIEAAADPADADYLYYVVVDPETGEHGFSETLEEHNRLRREVQAEPEDED